MDDNLDKVISEVHEKLRKVRDAPQFGDNEQTVIVDVVATLRTILTMYTAPEELPAKKPHKFMDILKGDQ